jgi:hypothetical protein
MPPSLHRPDLLRLACQLPDPPTGLPSPCTTGSARRYLCLLQPTADAEGLILLAPDSPDTTWDVAKAGSFGADVDFVDEPLDLVFTRYAVDPSRVVARRVFRRGQLRARSACLTATSSPTS